MTTDELIYPTIERYRLILKHEITVGDGTTISDTPIEYCVAHMCDFDNGHEKEIRNELLDELFTKSLEQIKEQSNE